MIWVNISRRFIQILNAWYFISFFLTRNVFIEGNSLGRVQYPQRTIYFPGKFTTAEGSISRVNTGFSENLQRQFILFKFAEWHKKIEVTQANSNHAFLNLQEYWNSNEGKPKYVCLVSRFEIKWHVRSPWLSRSQFSKGKFCPFFAVVFVLTSSNLHCVIFPASKRWKLCEQSWNKLVNRDAIYTHVVYPQSVLFHFRWKEKHCSLLFRSRLK